MIDKINHGKEVMEHYIKKLRMKKVSAGIQQQFVEVDNAQWRRIAIKPDGLTSKNSLTKSPIIMSIDARKISLNFIHSCNLCTSLIVV